MKIRLVTLANALLFYCSLTLADLSAIPYDPSTDRGKIASDLGISDGEILLDRRCVFYRTASWIASASSSAFSTCVLVLDPKRIILATFDSSGRRYVPLLTYTYSDIREIALRQDDSNRPDLELGGKKYQVQLSTPDGFVSITAYRGKIGDRPMDPRGAVDAFGIMMSKDIPVVESPGRVELAMPKRLFTFGK